MIGVLRMTYNELYVNSFKYGMMFGKDIKPGDKVTISVLDENDVVLAIKKAYIDMTPRTLKNQNEEEKQSLDTEDKAALFSSLATKIIEYIKNGTNDFDVWHNEICVYFMQEFAKILEKAHKISEDATYGKAQKIINMTFKYLYCYDDAVDYFERFVPCHMALDIYILNWFFSWYAKEYNKDKKRGEKITKDGKYHLPKWSNLRYEKDNQTDINPQYKEIQNAIRNHLKNSMPNTPPIEAEFLIWYNERKNS